VIGRKQGAHLLLAAAFLIGGVAFLLPSSTSAAPSVAPGEFTKTVTATRTFVDEDGTETAATTNDVTLSVSQTSDLRGRQEVHVSWAGAVPTGGVVGDPNSSDGRNQEYPFVILQCRGVDADATAVPQGQDQLTPETCWTQTSPERYLASATHTPPWRFDAYADPADRLPVVGAPDPLPEACAKLSSPLTARWVPIRAADGQVYYGGPDPGVGCATLPPETDSAEAGGLPSNTTYGITGTDGRGETDFPVWTAAENATLGCSATVQCALVAVPIVGVSCDAWGHRLPDGSAQTTRSGVPLTEDQLAAADETCRRTGAYQPGEAKSTTVSDQAVRGNLWWSPSNWRNRITVPLSFAATGSVCDAISKEAPQEIMGSIVMNELTASWRPAFCTTKGLFTFSHVQQSDALARTLVNAGEVDAAFSTAPRDGGYARPVVQAPTALGGFAIAFNIDGADRQRVTSLRLNARLVAKLLTTSYPAVPVVRDNHPSIGGNPLNITLDPEFQALNPGLPEDSSLDAAAALQTFSTNSDLMWALTSWIDADPEARAFLDGYPDPWGMRVNDSYRGIELPVDNWTLLDDFVAPQYYQDQNACYGNSAPPFLQLIANPASNLSTVLFNMQYASSAVQTVCKYDGYDPTTLPLRQQGRQTVGYRFVLGLVSLSAAERYNLHTASLQTTSTVPPARTFDNADGRTFVAPDTGGLRGAAALLEPDATAGLWTLDYPELSTEEGAAAYPGAMPVYTVVRTEGLEAETAIRMAKFLCYSGDQGQVSGLGNGQLPPGYLPVNGTNGMKAEHDYVLSAVAAIRAQAGDVPALDAVAPKRREACDFSRQKPTPTPTPTPTPSESAKPTKAPDPAPVTSPQAPEPSAPSAPEPSSAAPPSAPPVTEAPTVLTSGKSSGFGRLGTPGLLVLALGAAIAGAVMRWFDVLQAGLAVTRSRAGSGRRRGGGGKP
jgi:hypothetical protein